MTTHRLQMHHDLPTIIGATLRDAAGDYPSLTLTASRMCMSPRTLKRRLQSHGVRFRELLDVARYQRASTLLQNPSMTVEQVAAEVGYSCPANFSRAFRRWSGSPPGAFREALTARPDLDGEAPMHMASCNDSALASAA